MSALQPQGNRLTCHDIDGIVAALRVAYPADDPRELEMEELRDRVAGLTTFHDDPALLDAGLLETYRSLWWWGAGYSDTEPWAVAPALPGTTSAQEGEGTCQATT